MPELSPAPVRMQLLVGPGIPLPAPKFLLDALTEVKVEAGSGGTRSGFELSFSVPKATALLALFPTDVPVLRVVVAVTLNGVTEVLVDGVVDHHDVAVSGATTTLHVKGKDLASVMDIVPLDGIPYPAMPPSVRALTALAKYAFLGCVPMVIPSLMEDIPLPTDRIPSQRGTDFAYVTALAAEVGHVFYVDPGPVPGASIAYWGPEIRVGQPQPALNYGLGNAQDNVSTLNFTFDRDKKEIPIVFLQDPVTKVPLPIPIPDVTPLTPMLGLVPPLPPKTHMMRDTGRMSVLRAIMTGIAYGAAHSDAVFATGTLDVARYGRVLRSRRLVGVRGAGEALDGLYYVTRVTHELKRGAYTQSFSLARNGMFSTVPAVPA